MGIAYHGNYFTWFEVARIEMLESLGLPYRELEADGYLLPVLEAHARYGTPARFDDLLTIDCSIAEMPRVKIRIDYIVRRGDTQLTTGHTLHAFMDRDGYALKPSERFLTTLREHWKQ